MTQAASAARALLDDAGLRRVLALLDADGEDARIVGGAVRNALLGRPVSDFDITTTATPDVVQARAKAAGIRAIPTGVEHGTVTLMLDRRPFEVTTLREDIETDGRHAKIRFGRDFSRDALRRDFTINALSMDRDGTVHDYAGGLDDIANRRVRFIGDPATRIREDFLRILRFFRFSAEYADGAFDTDGLAATIGARAGLARLSRERVRQELLKLLVARRAVFAVTEMSDAGLLGPLLACVPQPARLGRVVAIAPEADATLRLAATAAIVPEDCERLQAMLRLSNTEAARLTRATQARAWLRGDAAPSPRELRERLFEDGRDGATDGLALAWAESRAGADDPAWRSAAAFLRDTPEPRLPFSGADLIARGIAQGRPLGVALKRLQANWIRAGFPSDPRTLARLLEEVAGG